MCSFKTLSHLGEGKEDSGGVGLDSKEGGKYCRTTTIGTCSEMFKGSSSKGLEEENFRSKCIICGQ